MPVHTMTGVLRIKRVYDPPDRSDGARVLVDRLWPRGVSKDIAKVDFWLKELGPSTELRKWFGHEPEKFAEFRRRYIGEIEKKPGLVSRIKTLLAERGVTLLFGARDTAHNNAVVLKEYLESSRRTD